MRYEYNVNVLGGDGDDAREMLLHGSCAATPGKQPSALLPLQTTAAQGTLQVVCLSTVSPYEVPPLSTELEVPRGDGCSVERLFLSSDSQGNSRVPC
jgi:hypothetical protein